MARTISPRALRVLATSPRITTRVSITVPGGEPTVLRTNPGWQVQEVGALAGTRLTISSIQFLPTKGVGNLFDLIGWPGARFHAEIGVYTGAEYEYIDVFDGYVVDGSNRRDNDGVTASLADGWPYFDEIPFTEPLMTTSKPRAQLIGDMWTSLDLGVSVIVTADGGVVSQSGVYTGTRGQASTQLAVDGLLQAGFNSAGDLVIKSQPVLTGDITPVWKVRGGGVVPQTATGSLAADYPTIVAGSLERQRAWSQTRCNAVAVLPSGDWQAWPAQIAELTDVDDKFHKDKIGLRPVEVVSATIDNACDALLLAKNELVRRRRGMAERVRWQCAINPAIEADDPVWIAAGAVVGDQGWNSTYIATSVTHDPKNGITTGEAVSAAAYSIGQAA